MLMRSVSMMRRTAALIAVVITATAYARASAGARTGVSLGDLIEQARESVQAELRSGVRAHLVREAQAVIPVVVVVPDAETAGLAISRWRQLLRFPVLIDDGTPAGAERIGRFVRAFGAERVVRWLPGDIEAWPEDRGLAMARIWELLGATVDQDGASAAAGGYVERIVSERIGPQGLVAIDPSDPAWVAGLALCAARYQFPVMIDASGALNQVMDPRRADELEATLRSGARVTGLTWTGIGDDLDAVTIAASVPPRVRREGGERNETLALTDVLGRRPSDERARWAGVGMIPGSSAASLYMAMCGLFLSTDSAWVFDSYEEEGNWRLYDGGAAAELLERGGWSVGLLDTPNQSLDVWRASVSRGIDAGLLLVTTKGRPDWFDLRPGRGRSGDVPLLNRPAVVHFVHSWSAQQVGARRTIAGRFLEHGAYAYVGSVHEPFLNAFVPPKDVAQRFAAGADLSMSVRHLNGPPWKINLFGDPLITMRLPGSAGQRLPKEALPIADVADVADSRREAVRSGAFADAVRLLVMEGKDEEAAKLVELMVSRDHASVDHELVFAAIPAMLRTGRVDAVFEAGARLDARKAQGTAVADALWHALPRVDTGKQLDAVAVLEGLRRSPHRVPDAERLAVIARQRAGVEAARALLERALAQAINDKERDGLGELLRENGGG